VVSFTLRPLYSRRKSNWYPLDRRLGDPQNRSGRREEEKILDPTGVKYTKEIKRRVIKVNSSEHSSKYR
jgi:hypothetical protein